jgi:pathogenesis-related protein 1
MVKNYLIKFFAGAISILVVSSTIASATPQPADIVNANAMVAAHNAIRQQVGVPSLSWSVHLTRYAQQWADHLKNTRGCGLEHRPRSGRFQQQYGENLYWASPIRWSDGYVEQQQISEQQVIASFAAERVNYDYASNTCQAGQICGHYTQMVWKDTTEVGCAKAVCSDKSMVLVCNYNPAGNYIGQRPY